MAFDISRLKLIEQDLRETNDALAIACDLLKIINDQLDVSKI